MTMLLLTTSIFKGEPSTVLLRMLKAAGAAVESGLAIRQLLLLQNTSDEAALAAYSWPEFVTVLTEPNIMSLSAARNILLDAARDRALLDGETVVAFPDDDSWYPVGLPAQLIDLFEGAPELDFAFSRYASGATPVSKLPTAPAKARDVVQNASSNTIFLRASLTAVMGGFDLELGVGTPNNGGEDLEYALCAFRAARRSIFLDAALVGHRDKDAGLRAKYYRGSLIALRRHSADWGIALQYLRKLAVGLALFVRRELSWQALLQAVSARPSATGAVPFPGRLTRDNA